MVMKITKQYEKKKKMSNMLDQNVNDLNNIIKTLMVLREKVGKLFKCE
jgi:hypothetical protein